MNNVSHSAGQYWSKAHPFLRNVVMLFLIAVFGVLATGCSKKKKTTAATPTPTPKVIVWRYGQDIDPLRPAIDSFKEKYPGVEVEYKKKDIENYEFESLKSIAAKQGPDVWSIPSDWLGDLQSQATPIPKAMFTFKDPKKAATTSYSFIAHSLYPKGIADQLVTPEDVMIGMPTNVDTLRLYINTAVFDAAAAEYRKSLGTNAKEDDYKPVQQLLGKPPKTWTELLEQSKYLTKRNGSTIERSAIAMGTANNIPDVNEIVQLLMLQNGAKIVSDDKKNIVFHYPETTPSGGKVLPGEKALEFFSSFSNPTKQNYSWNSTMPSAVDALGTGKVAMVIAYREFGNEVKLKYPKFEGGMFPVPQVSTSQAPVNLIRFSVEIVPKTTTFQTQALGLMKRYTSDVNALQLAAESKKFSPYKNFLEASDDALTKQILTGEAIYKRDRVRFDTAFKDMIIDTTKNGIAPDQAVITGADKLNEILHAKDIKGKEK